MFKVPHHSRSLPWVNGSELDVRSMVRILQSGNFYRLCNKNLEVSGCVLEHAFLPRLDQLVELIDGWDPMVGVDRISG